MNLLALRNKCKYEGRKASGSRVNKIIFLTRAIITSDKYSAYPLNSVVAICRVLDQIVFQIVFILAYMYHSHNVNQI